MFKGLVDYITRIYIACKVLISSLTKILIALTHNAPTCQRNVIQTVAYATLQLLNEHRITHKH